MVANDDETYTYNKRVNRLPPVQEHRMIVRAIERGVTAAMIADALGLEVQSIRARFRLLDGICPEAADMLKDTNCSMKVFDMLRRMSNMRQPAALAKDGVAGLSCFARNGGTPGEESSASTVAASLPSEASC
ncbi:plasmid partitioning protein RepB C-terminal domain-containing protein [Blastomonas fulva]|uniref:plasmid partitioning protein RepB C-terminal domain-containing protein n=1 Tax=Blastomonas fulva TaxID=1550728 RepID=UPI003D270AC0